MSDPVAWYLNRLTVGSAGFQPAMVFLTAWKAVLHFVETPVLPVPDQTRREYNNGGTWYQVPPLLFGGDGGSRTPVQKVGPHTSTGLSPCLSSPATPQGAKVSLGKPAYLSLRLTGVHPRSTRLADAVPPAIE